MNRQLWLQYGYALRFAALLGAFFGVTAGGLLIEPPLAGALFGVLSAVTDFVAGMVVIGAAEIFFPRTAAGRWLAGRPLPVAVLLKSLAYVGVLAAILGGRLGPGVVALVASPEMGRQIAAQLDASFPRGLLIVVASMMTFLLVMLRHASQLIGERSFRYFMRGRYRRPRREERFFLFVDIVGSTPVAERLGPLAVHRYLDRVFRIASDPVDDQQGEIYQYVGDEMVVTWTLAEGRPKARPIACFFAIEEALARAAPGFEREFGAVPRLRAALHAGETVTGEIGASRRAIVFHGDVMNTASRIENATRELGRPFLASADALERLEGVERYGLEDLGPRELRGRAAPVRVYALTQIGQKDK